MGSRVIIGQLNDATLGLKSVALDGFKDFDSQPWIDYFSLSFIDGFVIQPRLFTMCKTFQTKLHATIKYRL